MTHELTLWAESPEEARIFLERARRQRFAHKIERIFVAKKSAKNRANNYVAGEYFRTSNDDEVTVFEELIIAPRDIIDLVQWCTCDVMLSRGPKPLLVLEDTTHMVRMNVYQRIPRLFKAAMLGVPALALQGTRGLDFTKRGDCWGLHRYMRAFAAISRTIPQTPVLPFFYVPSDPQNDEAIAEAAAFQYIDCVVRGDIDSATKLRDALLVTIIDIEENGYQGHVARDIQSIEVTDTQVVVNIGAQPDKKSWKEKGSGQMDPYIGMIAAAKYIYCFDRAGAQVKEMVVRFKYLPQDFWWFRNWEESKSLYKTLAFEIADRVEFLG
jgi:hypothetical protein